MPGAEQDDPIQVRPVAPGEQSSRTRRLLLRDEVLWLLRLTDEQFQLLVNTRQITTIRICGVERFDSKDIDRLIDTYNNTASRRPQ